MIRVCGEEVHLPLFLLFLLILLLWPCHLHLLGWFVFCCEIQKKKEKKEKSMEHQGFDPRTLRMQSECSTN